MERGGGGNPFSISRTRVQLENVGENFQFSTLELKQTINGPEARTKEIT